MRKKICAFAACFLIFAMLFSIVALGAPDVGEDSASFKIKGPGSELYLDIESEDIFEGANTLAIALSNGSSCAEVELEFVYSDGRTTASKLKLAPNSTAKTYTLSLENCTDIVGIRMNFGQTEDGEITVHFVKLVPFFYENVDPIGEISLCKYESGTLILRGTLRHDAIREHKESTISVYALEPGQDVGDILSGAIEPIIKDRAISIRFEFSIDIRSDIARLFKYVAVVVGENGIEFIDAPRYPDVSAPNNAVSFKGIESNTVFGTAETGAGLSVLPISTDELLSATNNGYMYTLDGERYFFDRNYVVQLDKKVSAVSGAASDVYLRLSDISPVLDKNSQCELYAIVRFLASRYSSVSECGVIKGIIIGEAVNRNITNGLSLSEFALASYDSIHTVYAASNDAENPLDAIISVSEDICTEPTLCSVSSELYLEALFSVCGYYSENRFYVMTEAESNPYEINNEYIDNLADITLDKSDPDCDYVTSDNIVRFYSLFGELARRSIGQAPKLIYSWSPADNTSGTALSAAYVYNYYKLYFSQCASAFVVSPNGDDAEQIQAINELKYKMKYIDTEKSLEICDFAREIFSIDDWENEISGFSPDALAKRELRDANQIGTEMPNDILGTFYYWNFKNLSGHSGWQAGAGVSSLHLENNSSGGRALNASVHPSEILGEYAFFSYAYEFEENFRYNDYLLLDLLINSPHGGKFEVNIMLGGDEFVYEYRSSEITAGIKYSLSLDIGDMTEKDSIKYIRICTKELTPSKENYTVSLYSVSAASRTLTGEELGDRILDERDRIHGATDGEAESGPNILWIIISAATVIITVIVMIAIGRSKKRARPE
ncbi:MAG: hypothetical protein E7640_06295 [Ruminococcaceae bacterium]|nr:hypothetical protein [Oscillospiraceae bacterium]